MYKQLWDILVLLLIFVGVLLLAYFVTKKIAMFQTGKVTSKNLKIKEVLQLGQGQYLYIIAIGEEYHLFSSTKEHITYCMPLNKELLKIQADNSQAFEHYLKHLKMPIQEKKHEKEK